MIYKILHKATEEQINELTAHNEWHVHTFTVDSRDGEIVVLLESMVSGAVREDSLGADQPKMPQVRGKK